MIYCPKCSGKNEDDAKYCNKCGNALITTKKNYKKIKTKSTLFEKQVEDFAEGFEKAGKKVGKKIEQAAKKFGNETQDLVKKIENITKRSSTHAENWYNRTFGIFGPLLSSFIGLIVLRLVIEGLKIGAKDNPILADVGDGLFSNIFLLFGVLLISGYTEYFSKKYRPFQWITPIIIAIVVVIITLVVGNIISVVGSAAGEQDIVTASSEWIKNYILMLYILVLLSGYLILIAMISMEKD